MSKKKKPTKQYPESVDVKSRPDLHGYGANRIYRITKDEAISISKEFGLPTDFREWNWDDESEYDFYYLNHAYGEQHLVFWMKKSR